MPKQKGVYVSNNDRRGHKCSERFVGRNFMKRLIEHYAKLGCRDFYERVLTLVKDNPNEFIDSSTFLEGVKHTTKHITRETIQTTKGDIRIDVPVWFGNLNSSTCACKIIVIGIQPRDTHSSFNVAKIGNKVFATAFGIDRWNKNSSISHKPQNKYFRVFKNIIHRTDIFILFTDTVKEYEVVGGDKGVNDKNSKNNFANLANKWKTFLLEELTLVDPDYILALGNVAFSKVNNFCNRNYTVTKIKHPSHGGEKEAKRKIEELITHKKSA